jgi:hypothetical protein
VLKEGDRVGGSGAIYCYINIGILILVYRFIYISRCMNKKIKIDMDTNMDTNVDTNMDTNMDTDTDSRKGHVNSMDKHGHWTWTQRFLIVGV